MKSEQSSVTFYCFTPLVSLVTFLIEIGFALYIFWKYQSTAFSRLSIIFLSCLALFQLAEYQICTSPDKDMWVRVGYISITLLPSLGIHLVSLVTKRRAVLTSVSYILAGAFIGALFFIPEITLYGQCMPNYVAIHVNWLYGLLYKIYYLGFILVGMRILWYSLQKNSGDRKIEKWMLIAYSVFLIPSLILYYLQIFVKSSLPSVMCGIAIITAFIFVFIIIPRHYQIAGKKKKVRLRGLSGKKRRGKKIE